MSRLQDEIDEAQCALMGRMESQQEPDPTATEVITEAELDALCIHVATDFGAMGSCEPPERRIARALRACRREVDLVRENLDSFRAPVEVGGKQLSIAGRVFALGERDEACRAQSKAKDAVVEALSQRNQGIGAQSSGKEWRVEIYFPTKAKACAVLNACEALDSKAGGGEG